MALAPLSLSLNLCTIQYSTFESQVSSDQQQQGTRSQKPVERCRVHAILTLFYGGIACVRRSWRGPPTMLVCTESPVLDLQCVVLVLEATTKAIGIAVRNLSENGESKDTPQPTTKCDPLRTFESTTCSVMDVILPTIHSHVFSCSARLTSHFEEVMRVRD